MIPGLSDRITAIGASALALVLGLALGWQTLQLMTVRGDLKDAKAALTAARADLRTCQSNRLALTASIDAQNRALDGLRKESESKVAESAKAVRSARAVAESARREADRIMSLRVGGSCEDAERVWREATR